MAIDWRFLKGGSGRVSADNMAEPLRNTPLTPEELLVREALQNSVDEMIKGENWVRFRISAKKLIGQQKQTFIKKMKFDQIKNKSVLFDPAHNWYGAGLKTLETIEDPEIPLRVLEISDHNANGLSGKWNVGQSIQDRFYNLVLSIAKTRKQEEGTGTPLGSYGFGKMVFSLSSALRTMVYYSHFPTDERSGDDNRRLMATAFLPSYFEEENDTEYTGHAYLGLDSGQENNPAKPLANKQADDFFSGLGFKTREDGDYGTTVLIPGCDFKMEELAKAIEKWWWPLLLKDDSEGKIKIELVEDDGTELELNPQQREDLYPFIKASNNSRDAFSADKKARSQEIKVNVQGQKVPGNLSCLRLPKGSQNSLKNHVALIRDNLVIQYWDRAFREEALEAVGVFFVTNKNPELKKKIIFSEPAAHDQFNEHNNRLMAIYGTEGSDLVRQLKNQIREKCRDFQTTLEQITRPKDDKLFSFLDNILGPLIKPRKIGPNPSPPDSRPRIQTIQKKSKTVMIDGVKHSELHFEFGLVDEAEVEEMDFDLNLSCAVLADDNQTADKKLQINLMDRAGNNASVIQPGQTQQITIQKNAKYKGIARSKIHPSWIIAWGLRLDKSEYAE